MNINVIVLNVNQGFQPQHIRSWGRGRPDDFSRTSVTPDSRAPVEEVIELTPQDGVWVGERNTSGGRSTGKSDAQGAQKMFNLSTVTTYDQRGRLSRSVQGKGLRIDIVA